MRLVKRAMDAALAAALLAAASPLMAVAAAAVRLRLGSPVLFKQTRPGLHGRPFTLYKLRTMSSAVDRDGRLLPDAERLTRLGRVLRAASVDELFTLWNVLKGDMSMVGPRPLLMHYLDRYTPEQARRHDVRPGITGLAQVSGRNELSWDDKLALDVWYVDHQSLWLDLSILARTVGVVLRRVGVTAAGHATAPEFTGSDGER